MKKSNLNDKGIICINNKFYSINLKEVKFILDDIEREYLSNIVKPFRKRNPKICKILLDNGEDAFIVIYLDEIDTIEEILFTDGEYICLPYFKKDSMYKGMEIDKEYTLEELGL